MDSHSFDRILEETLDDLRLSRSERKALLATIDEQATNDHDLEVIRARAFDLARRRFAHESDRQVVGWLEDVVKAIYASREPTRPIPEAEVYFSPGSACADRLIGLLGGLQHTAELCVFTITDNRISRAILGAHHRGVRIRIVSDDWKASDLGSDIDELERAGIPVALDSGPAHMHNKFALFDNRLVATGSYNWTRSAAEENQENLVVTNHPQLLSRFQQEFERLWKAFTS